MNRERVKKAAFIKKPLPENPEVVGPPGVTYSPPGTEFVLWSPLSDTLELLIELHSLEESPVQDPSVIFHDKRPYRVHRMSRDEEGYWRAVISVPVRSRFYYRIDGKTVCPDPASLSQPRGVQGPSEVVERKKS